MTRLRFGRESTKTQKREGLFWLFFVVVVAFRWASIRAAASSTASSCFALDYNGPIEVPLSRLPERLAADPSTWPRPDLSVDPQEISVTRDGSQVVVSAVVRNNGGSIARSDDVHVSVSDGEKGPNEMVVVDVPPQGQVEIRRRFRFTETYGVALVHAMHGTTHAACDSVHFDRAPEDAIAFRVLNAPAAPPDYAARIRRECGGVCRGY